MTRSVAFFTLLIPHIEKWLRRTGKCGVPLRLRTRVLSVYAPAIEKRIVTPTTSVVDEKIKIKDWELQNAYSGFKGQMTVKKAV